MTYPQQPGNWSDPSSPAPQPAGYQDPAGQGGGQPVSGQPVSGQPVGYPDPAYQSAQPAGTNVPPGYPAYGYPVAAAAPPTNGMAIAALVLSLVGIASCITAPIGAILGHVASRQIRERGEGGAGMAKAAIIVGWVLTGLMLLACAGYIAFIVFAINNPDMFESSSTY